MIMKQIMPRTGIEKLNRALDAYSLRQRVIAENIANIDTVGYRGKRVAFEEKLKESLADKIKLAPVPTHPRHIPLGSEVRKVASVKERDSSYFNGTNNVNVSKEMTNIAKATLAYNMTARLIKGRIKSIRSAITGNHG